MSVQCEICGKMLKGAWALEAHKASSERCAWYQGKVKSVDQGCPDCGKTVKSGSWALYQHQSSGKRRGRQTGPPPPPPPPAMVPICPQAPTTPPEAQQAPTTHPLAQAMALGARPKKPTRPTPRPQEHRSRSRRRSRRHSRPRCQDSPSVPLQG